MVETAGMKLRRMRVLRQLSLADAARQTRISAARLGDLETDEYSNFPNLAYAKSFLRSYARFLNVDLQAYVEAFEDTSTFGLDDYQYLSDKPVGVYRIPRRPQRSPKLRRRSLVMTASLVGVFAIVVVAWFFYITYKRLGGNLSELADRQEARDHGTLRFNGAQPATNSLIPVSSTPAPAATASPAPRSTPAGGDSSGSELVAITLAESSPSAVLTRLSLPAASLPAPPAITGPGDAIGMMALRPMMQKVPFLDNEGALLPVNGTSAPSAANPDGNHFYVHRLDSKSVDIFRTGVPKPKNPAGNNLD